MRKRILYIDILRIIACLSAIMIHISCKFCGNEFVGTSEFIISCIYNGISKISVPLFVMISGSLILDESYIFDKSKNIKHIKNLIIFLLFWSFVYLIITVRGDKFNLEIVIEKFISEPYHLWFIYMIISLYIVTPLLRLWVNKANKKYVKFFLILSIIFGIIVTQFKEIISLTDKGLLRCCNIFILEKIDFNYTSGYIIYYILGWYLHNFEINKKYINCLGMFGFIITIFTTIIVSKIRGEYVNVFFQNLTLNVLLQSAMIFCLIKNRFYNNRQKENINEIILLFSNATLGVYGIHIIVINVVDKLMTLLNINLIIYIFIEFILVCMISFSIVTIMKKLRIKYIV